MPKKTNSKQKSERQTYYPGNYPCVAKKILLILASNSFLSSSDLVDIFTNSPRNKYPHGRLTNILKQFLDIDYVSEFGVVTGPKHQCRFRSRRYFFQVNEKGKIARVIETNSKVEKRRKTGPYTLKKIGHGLICKQCKRFVLVKLRGNSKILTTRCWNLSFNGILVVLTLLDQDELWEFIKKYDNEILKLAKILVRNQKKEDVDLLINRLRKVVKEEPNLIPIAESWYKEMKQKIPKFRINESRHQELARYKIKLVDEQQREIIMNARPGHFFRKLG